VTIDTTDPVATALRAIEQEIDRQFGILGTWNPTERLQLLHKVREHVAIRLGRFETDYFMCRHCKRVIEKGPTPPNADPDAHWARTVCGMCEAKHGRSPSPLERAMALFQKER
jgi:hypothetical protein